MRGQPKPKRAQRQVFTFARDAATRCRYMLFYKSRCRFLTTYRIHRNASCSPLLRLPLEIRMQIYKLLLGDRILHMENNHWRHAAIQQDRSTCNRLSEWCDRCHLLCVPCFQDADQNSQGSDMTYHSRHYNCTTIHQYGGARNTDRPDLSILLCCRQLYNESNLTLWTSNTFAFDNPKVFLRFVQAVGAPRRNLIRNLQLYMNYHYWHRPNQLIFSMRGLRSLDLIIASCFTHSNARMIINDPSKLFEFSFEPVLAFRLLPLTHVRVTVEHAGSISFPGCWTESDRDDLARLIERQLTDPHRSEKHAEEVKSRLEKCEAERARIHIQAEEKAKKG